MYVLVVVASWSIEMENMENSTVVVTIPSADLQLDEMMYLV